ncbi:MAG: tetratricopeptide repeat protein [Byssovorax sp.]
MSYLSPTRVRSRPSSALCRARRSCAAYDPPIVARSPRRRVRLTPTLLGVLLGGALGLGAPAAVAGPGDTAGQKGQFFARKGNCEKAVPLLEEAELARHRPSFAVPLADCYLVLGEIVQASELYDTVAADKPERFWVGTDYNAQKTAKKKAAEVGARLPTVRFESAERYTDLEVELGGKVLSDPTAPKKVAPDASIPLVVRAKGRKELRDKLVLNEGEHRTVKLRLEPLTPPAKPAGPSAGTWIGARYRGVIIPRFVMNIAADGGRFLIVPGAAATLTIPSGDIDLMISLGYLSYRMGDTPFKPKDRPDTEWEIISSDLQALTATLDLLWTIPIDRGGHFSFRIGGGVGIGYTFLGDLYRTQAYPADFKPGDPYTYLKCEGPNNPRGSYRYCNTLDKDATHYGGYTEPSWFARGIRPLIFPWLTLPELGFTYKPVPQVAIDIEGGVTLSGFLTGLGLRVAL